MENLRILFICPQPLWPTNTGARLRNLHLARALAAKCSVSVLQITQSGEKVTAEHSHDFEHLSAVQRGRSYTPWKVLRGVTGPLPVTVLNYTSRNVAKVLAETLAATQYDAVQMESIHLSKYLDTIRRAQKPPLVLLDWHNIESELMQRYAESARHPVKRLIAKRTATLLRNLEMDALQSFSAHTVVSEREKQKLLARDPNARIEIIENGVDTHALKNERRAAPAGRQTLLFVGSMDYHANTDAVIWFCREIWPQLTREFPNIYFKIVGRNPSGPVMALASERIIITGTVEDVIPHYEQAFAVLVPLRVGGGTRLKILEAMAASVPVISTRLGAEGLDATDGREILIADDAAGMSAAIRTLLEGPNLVRQICEAALQLVTKKYDWSVLGEKLAKIYSELRS